MKKLTISLKDIPALAKNTARQLKGGEVLALVGDLGSGKTAFAKALGKELRIRKNITSPTFTLMNRYEARLPKAGKRTVYLYHLDLYRTRNFREVKALGIEEVWGKNNAVVLIEWADKISRHLPRHSLVINFSGPQNL